jgi:excisionase family DNA binding protein
VTERLFTTREVAELLSVSPETILRWYRAGRIKGVPLASNVLRFRESAIDAMIAEAEGGMAGGTLIAVGEESAQ